MVNFYFVVTVGNFFLLQLKLNANNSDFIFFLVNSDFIMGIVSEGRGEEGRGGKRINLSLFFSFSNYYPKAQRLFSQIINSQFTK